MGCIHAQLISGPTLALRVGDILRLDVWRYSPEVTELWRLAYSVFRHECSMPEGYVSKCSRMYNNNHKAEKTATHSGHSLADADAITKLHYSF